eukprot:348821_1
MLYDHPNQIKMNTIYWLEISLLVIMWIHKSYAKYLERIGAVIVFILTSIYIYYTFYDDSTISATVQIFGAFHYCGYGIVRLMLIYYFLKEFVKYPWIDITEEYHASRLLIYYITSMKRTNIRVFIGFSLYVILMGSHFYSAAFQLNSHNTLFEFPIPGWLRITFDLFVSGYAVYIPLGLSQCVLTFIILKYELYLHTVVDKFDLANNQHRNSDRTDYINTVFVEYRKMQQLFKDQYKTWQYILSFEAIVLFYVLWVIVATIIHTEGAWNDARIVIWAFSGFFYVIPMIEFVYCASRMNNEYNRLQDILWEFSLNYNEDNHDIILVNRSNSLSINATSSMLSSTNAIGNGMNSGNKYNVAKFIFDNKFQAFFQYVRCHPFYVTLMGTKVTAANAVKFMIAFGIAKMISYSIYYI